MIWQYCRIPPRDIDWVHDINRLTHRLNGTNIFQIYLFFDVFETVQIGSAG